VDAVEELIPLVATRLRLKHSSGGVLQVSPSHALLLAVHKFVPSRLSGERGSSTSVAPRVSRWFAFHLICCFFIQLRIRLHGRLENFHQRRPGPGARSCARDEVIGGRLFQQERVVANVFLSHSFGFTYRSFADSGSLSSSREDTRRKCSSGASDMLSRSDQGRRL